MWKCLLAILSFILENILCILKTILFSCWDLRHNPCLLKEVINIFSVGRSFRRKPVESRVSVVDIINRYNLIFTKKIIWHSVICTIVYNVIPPIQAIYMLKKKIVFRVLQIRKLVTYAIPKVYFWDNSACQRNVCSNYWIRKIAHVLLRELIMDNGHDACISNVPPLFTMLSDNVQVYSSHWSENQYYRWCIFWWRTKKIVN